MRPTKILLVFMVFGVSNSQAMHQVCFKSKEYKEQTICYTTDPEKDRTAKDYFIKFTKNINSPGALVSLQGEMKKRYTLERFHKSLIKYYSHISPESIEQIISKQDLSAIYLKSGQTLYFDHSLTAFVFDFDKPLIFAGASIFYAGGSKPIKQTPHINKSICNLSKDGVLFLSPNRESLFYKSDSTFCTYADMYFDKKSSDVSVRPVSSIGKKGYSISGASIDLSDFLEWLQKP